MTALNISEPGLNDPLEPGNLRVIDTVFKMKQCHSLGPLEVYAAHCMSNEPSEQAEISLGDSMNLTPIEELSEEDGRGHSGDEQEREQRERPGDAVVSPLVRVRGVHRDVGQDDGTWLRNTNS